MRLIRQLLPVSLIIYLCTLCSCGDEIPSDVQLVSKQLFGEVDFNFDIRPILADRCFACHGPDEKTRKSGLRLDLEEGAFATLENSTARAVVPGDLGKSEAWRRIISDDPELVMPPPESNLVLSLREKALLAKWIEEGAVWKDHWSFIPPVLPEVATDLPANWARQNPIDHFIQHRLRQQNLVPSPEADRERLIRRLSFDLTGLPPSLTEIDDFVNDESKDAYEQLVDRLLESDGHAERLAMEWLDVARYADSHGMHADGLRIMWRWRDWVIKAFSNNLAFDDFATWQIAGDLLPNASREQKLATGFYRNQPLNTELGIVTEEYRLKYVADRTNTTATAFLGMTMECASCHDHKFDPISQKEYYEMSAFFNNIKELGMIGNDLNFGPLLLLPDTMTERKIADLSRTIDRMVAKKDSLADTFSIRENNLERWNYQKVNVPRALAFSEMNALLKDQSGKSENLIDGNKKVVATGTPLVVKGKNGNGIHINSDYDRIHFKGLDHFDLYQDFSAGAWVKTEKQGTFQTIIGNIGDKNSGWRGWLFFIDTLNRPGLKLVNSLSHNYIHVVAEQSVSQDEWSHLFFSYDGSATAEGVKIYLNGKQLEARILWDNLYKTILPVKFRNYQPDPGRSVRMGLGSKYLFSETDDAVFYGAYDQVKIFDKELTGLEIAKISGRPWNDFSPADLRGLAKEHRDRRQNPSLALLEHNIRELRKQKYDLLNNVEEVMVMQEMPAARSTFILNRGQYDDLGDEVFMNTPKSILPFSDEYPKNRLGLARWLFSPRQPLTARVVVNRYWQMIFGRGLVSTPHDFGIQGSLPSHPQLLDWLALEFMESDWNLRKLIKLMVMSATYRQSSILNDSLREKDVNNVWLARGPSHRLPLEMIRDNALAASGLLNGEIGGESVKPYQPEGLWKEKNEFSGFLVTYEPDSGLDLYRRSMYTFIRRTSPPPIMTIFDAPNRDVCSVKREVTNTPLQALVLLNDPQFIEAARILSERIQKEKSGTIADKISYGFRLACGRHPKSSEIKTLMAQYQYEINKLENEAIDQPSILFVGEKPFDKELKPTQTAALAMVCNTMLNFDEAYMKR